MLELEGKASTTADEHEQSYFLRAAVSLARLERCLRPEPRAHGRSRTAGHCRGSALGALTTQATRRASTLEQRRATRQALRGLGALLRVRGVEPADLVPVLRDAVRFLLQLSGLSNSAGASALERTTIHWGIEGYNAGRA